MEATGAKKLNNKNRVKLAQFPTERSSDFEVVGMSLAENWEPTAGSRSADADRESDWLPSPLQLACCTLHFPSESQTKLTRHPSDKITCKSYTDTGTVPCRPCRYSARVQQKFIINENNLFMIEIKINFNN